MPNWCSNEIVFYADGASTASLLELHKFLSELLITPSSAGNDFGRGWLGNVAIRHGLEFNEETGNLVREDIGCRGHITHVDEIDDEETSFGIMTETAWIPTNDLWGYVCEQYEGVHYVVCAEEPGCGVFLNTDIDGVFLPDRYVLMGSFTNSKITLPSEYFKEGVNISEHLDKIIYFPNLDELLKHMQVVTDAALTSVDEINKFFKKALKCFDEDASVHVYEFSTDWGN